MTKVSFLVGGCSFEWQFSFRSLNFIINEISKTNNSRISIDRIYYFDLENRLFDLEYLDTFSTVTTEICIENGKLHHPNNFLFLISNRNNYIYSLIQGQQGEDGLLQALMRYAKCKSNIDSIISAALTTDKWLQSIIVQKETEPLISPIPSVCISSQKELPYPYITEVINKFHNHTCILKPNNLGGSLFVEQKEVLDRNTLLSYQKLVKYYDDRFLVQRKIFGQEIVCNILVTQSGIELLPIFAVNKVGALMDYEEKFVLNEYSWEIYKPSDMLQSKINIVAEKLQSTFNFKCIFRLDLIVQNDNLFFLEINLMPSLYQDTLLQRALSLANISIVDYILLGKEKSREELLLQDTHKNSIIGLTTS